jgi:phenylacetic acid degradation operon negative regulatory protein
VPEEEHVKAASPGRRVVARPNSFIFTLYGDMVHQLSADGTLWIGALIRLMAPFGISPAAVRQAVSRMSRQGWLTARREGNRAFYAVTERGRSRIEELSPRIYGPVVEWDGRWRLLVYDVAERHRKRRDRLRKELQVLGWAPLSASIWISPADALDAAKEAAQAVDAGNEIQLFSGAYRGPLSDRELIERCWDLPAIASAYDEFVQRYRPKLDHERQHHSLRDEAAFVDRLWLVYDYRKFTYLDPGLPSELLPAHWPGTTAGAIFREYYATIAAKSQHYFLTLIHANGAAQEHVEATPPCPNAS